MSRPVFAADGRLVRYGRDRVSLLLKSCERVPLSGVAIIILLKGDSLAYMAVLALGVVVSGLVSLSAMKKQSAVEQALLRRRQRFGNSLRN